MASHLLKMFGMTIVLIILWSIGNMAQDMAVPAEVQFPLLAKILTFDRNLQDRVGDEIVIAIVYQRKYRRSLNVKDNLFDIINKSSIKAIEAIPIQYLSIDLDNTDLAKTVSMNKVDILYITPIRAVSMETITAVSRANKILTFTGVQEYVQSGLAMGIGIKGGKPNIIINLAAAKIEGADFSSRLLKLVKVIE